MRALRRADRVLLQLRRRRRGARATSREVGAPIVVKADGLAAGKGVHSLRHGARRRRRRSTRSCAVRSSATPATESSSRSSCRARKSRSWPSPTARRCCRWRRRRTTSAPSTATRGPNTGGMGAYSPAPVVTRGARTSASWSEVMRPMVRGLAERRHRLPGRAVRGLMITDGRPEGAGVQRPLRRPGVPGDDAASAGRPAGADGGGGRRAGSADVTLRLGPPRRGVRRAGGRGVSGQLREGQGDPRARDVARLVDGVVFHAGTARRDDAGRDQRRPGARGHRAWATASRRRSPRRTAAWRRSVGTECTTVATSGTGRCEEGTMSKN